MNNFWNRFDFILLVSSLVYIVLEILDFFNLL